ncbi:hypothetical protein KR222_009673, partial [Zaprionus bogoriensis]
FETAHKVPEGIALGDEGFHTAHRISIRSADPADYSMNLLATKERPELNPVLSALINEDVMKSIEAKRAIEEEELAEVRREIEEAALSEQQSATVAVTDVPAVQLTTVAPAATRIDRLDDDMLVDPHDDFVNQNFALDGAGSENNKKSRIEIKKAPNGKEYEYEYLYYYEDDEDADSKAKPAIASPAAVEAPAELTPEVRGKTRYSNIDRSTPATPSENSLQSGKAKGRASSAVSSDNSEDIEAERLPQNTRFPSRGKNIDVQPTPALDSLETAAERKKISVKRPSLELVDSQTFNTDEKQLKGSRNGDKELKPVIAIEQEQAAAAAAAAAAAKAAKEREEEHEITAKQDEEAEQTTPSMEKAALDLYAILTNENLKMEETTAADVQDETTLGPDTASTDPDSLTTLQEELSSTTTSTTTTPSTTTTTTTTEAPTTTTTTTTTAAPSLFGGRRSGLSGLAGRNRFKLRDAGATSTTTTTEAAPTEAAPKTGRNRFSRPSIGGRSRPGARTTASPEPAAEAAVEEEIAPVKEVKPVSSGFARGRPRNRFNLRGSSTTTTERSAAAGDEESADGASAAEAAPSTTARSTLRNRPALNLRGRSRTTTTRAPPAEGAAGSDEANSGAAADEGKAAAPAAAAEPVRPSRFNLHRAGGNRLLPRGKLGRAGVSTEAPKEAAEDSAADSSHHNDVKGGEAEAGADAGGEKTEEGDAASATGGNHAVPVSGLNRLKNRPRLNAQHKTDATKPRAAAAAGAAASAGPAAASGAAASPAAPRKINPLLAKRRLQLG